MYPKAESPDQLGRALWLRGLDSECGVLGSNYLVFKPVEAQDHRCPCSSNP